MELLRVGSASQYAKSMARRTQWDLKKRSGDFSGHKTSLRDYVNVTKASSVLPRTDEADNKMSAIMAKAQAGRELSHDDWEYLKAKNPAMYEKLKAAEKEQKDYEEALKRCKTRDEARRLHMSKLGEILSAAKGGDESALVRLNRVTRTMINFTKSGECRDMPTEAEQAIGRERGRQAEREALRAEASKAERDALQAEASEAERDAVQAETEAAQGERVPKDSENAEAESVSGDAAARIQADGASAHGSALFGQRAYLRQRDGESRRRKVFDAQA